MLLKFVIEKTKQRRIHAHKQTNKRTDVKKENEKKIKSKWSLILTRKLEVGSHFKLHGSWGDPQHVLYSFQPFLLLPTRAHIIQCEIVAMNGDHISFVPRYL